MHDCARDDEGVGISDNIYDPENMAIGRWRTKQRPPLTTAGRDAATREWLLWLWLYVQNVAKSRVGADAFRPILVAFDLPTLHEIREHADDRDVLL